MTTIVFANAQRHNFSNTCAVKQLAEYANGKSVIAVTTNLKGDSESVKTGKAEVAEVLAITLAVATTKAVVITTLKLPFKITLKVEYRQKYEEY